MKTLHALFGITLLAAGAVAACESETTPTDDDDTSSGAGASGGGTGGMVLDDSERLNQADIERRTYFLASDEMAGRAPGSAGGLAARQYIIDEMTACGIQPLNGDSFEQGVTPLNGASNIVGYIPGTDPALKDRYVMVSAHYDHLGESVGTIYNGADDNAVAVAVSIAVGCAIADNPQPRSVIIANWDSEEPPNFLQESMGSRFYANNPVVPLAQTDAVIVLDLIGGDLWPGYNNHMLLGAELSPQVAAAVDAAPVPDGLLAYRGGLHLIEEWPLGIGHQPWSDYDEFRNLGAPVLFLANAQTMHYHQPTDTPETINYPKVALEAKLLLRITSRLANGAENSVFDSAGADYARDAATMAAMLEHAVAQGGMVDTLGLTAQTRTSLESDLANAQAIDATLSGGGSIGDTEIRQLRDAGQRLLCLASPLYAENQCNLF